MSNISIPNATVTPTSGGAYFIQANSGYVLHDKDGGWYGEDPETGVEVFNRAYYRGICSCGANYDFTPSQITLENGTTVTAYGYREFFAIPESEAPENNIFGVTSKPEIM